MAKINHNNTYDTIDRVIENAKNKQTIHLYAEDETLKGDSLCINGKKLWHFATTGYLGLEQDIRIKQAAAEAIFKYGTQFPLSKTYISHPLYRTLEQKIELIYEEPVIIAKNSTLAHMAVIPQAISDNDVVILDHQVHWSVQTACQLLKTRGVPVLLIRHNNMEQLEDYLVKYKDKHQKIWYMADGIYSMYGDHAPIDKLKQLIKKYPCLHIYFDDVHGMSWIGERGAGFVKSHWSKIPENMVLISTLSKTFGASGATIICGDKELQQKIKNFGGPLTFSAQLEPSAVAAAIASADIHLSGEIDKHQKELNEKINLFKKLLRSYNHPLIAYTNTPVFYLGTALPETAYSLVNRLQNKGFFVNPGIYPAVPLKNAGIRITISNHNQMAQIEELAAVLNTEFPLALKETNNTIEYINKAFGLSTRSVTLSDSDLKVSTFKSIKEIDKTIWNSLLGKDNALDYEGMLFVESYFGNLDKKNPNYMDFGYIKIESQKGQILALASVSMALWKEDMLSNVLVSEKLEEIRKKDPFFLVNKTLSTGSTFTEGNHMYMDANYKNQRTLKDVLLYALEQEFSLKEASKMVLRDFSKGDTLGNYFLDKGYLIIEMPQTAIFKAFDFTESSDFENVLTKRSKRHFKNDILPYIDTYEIKIQEQLSDSELQKAYELFLNVKENNLAINNFTYAFGLFEAMNKNNNWSFLQALDPLNHEMVGVVFCYKNGTNNSFNPILIGMSDSDQHRLILYRQLLFQTILYAKKENFNKIYFGVSAIFEKRKLGAKVYDKEAYVQLVDHYATDFLESFK